METGTRHQGNALKEGYYSHLASVNSDTDLDAMYEAACRYYRLELGAALPSGKDAPCLDIGFGFGHLLRYMLDSGCRYVSGVELDPELFALAQSRIGDRCIELCCDDALAFLAKRPNQYAFITAYDLIEHFPTAIATELAKLVRGALIPGGTAVFRTPNMAHILGTYSRYLDVTHQCGFTNTSLAQVLRLAGFHSPVVIRPVWRKGGRWARKMRLNAFAHRIIYRLQDRTCPECLDKNLVMAAKR